MLPLSHPAAYVRKQNKVELLGLLYCRLLYLVCSGEIDVQIPSQVLKNQQRPKCSEERQWVGTAATYDSERGRSKNPTPRHRVNQGAESEP